MVSDNPIKGYSLALLATVAGSTVYIFSKSAFQQVTLAQFGVYWFAFALFWNFLYALVPSETPKLHRIRSGTHKRLIAIGMLELAATTTFYAAIQSAVNPAIPSFLRNMEYIFVTLLGVFILHEKFSKKEAAGAVLTSIGQYSALKYLEASRTAIIQSTTALFVLTGAYLVFGRFPLAYQLVGGALTIVGPMWLILGRKRRSAVNGT